MYNICRLKSTIIKCKESYLTICLSSLYSYNRPFKRRPWCWVWHPCIRTFYYLASVSVRTSQQFFLKTWTFLWLFFWVILSVCVQRWRSAGVLVKPRRRSSEKQRRRSLSRSSRCLLKWTRGPSWWWTREPTSYLSCWTLTRSSARRRSTARCSAAGSASWRSWAPTASALRSASTSTARPAWRSTSRSRYGTATFSALIALSPNVPP